MRRVQSPAAVITLRQAQGAIRRTRHGNSTDPSPRRGALLALTPGAARAQAETLCQIVRVTAGAVEIRRGRKRVVAVVGHVLATGDRLRTDAAGRATVRCDTGLTLDVGPATRIVLDGLLVPAPRGAGVRLLEGIAGFLLPAPRPGGFEVRTPSAVAAVRSTDWAVAVEDGATAAFVRDGVVAVAGRSGAVALAAGQGVDVTARGAVGEIKAWGDARTRAFADRLGPDWRARAR